MDEELIDSILLDYCLKQLPSFGGKRSEDVNKWLVAITDGFNLMRLNDDHKVRMIHKYLTGDARIMIINNMAVLNDWTSFVQLIRRTFDSSFQKQVVIPQVNDVKRELNVSIIQREHVVVESVDIIEGQKMGLVEDEEPLELIQEEETVKLVQREEEEETVKLVQEEEEEVKLVQEGEEEEETVKLVQEEEEEETVKLVQEEKAVKLGEEKEEETVELIQEDQTVEWVHEEGKDGKNFDNCITTSVQNEKILNEIVDINNGLLSTNMLQGYENMDIIIHILSMIDGKHQLIQSSDITRLKNNFSTCPNNGSIDISTYLKYGTNRQTFWCNFSPYKTNHWEWFRTLAVP